MAPLQVIGAGYGRTGTDSLRTALNMLGYNCHHMREMFQYGRHPEKFTEAFKHPEKPVEWDTIYEGYDAAVDWPTVAFIDRLMVQYPDAKFILTIRDADSWYKSVKNTIWRVQHKTQAKDAPADLPEDIKNQFEMIRTIVLDGAFDDLDRFLDEERIKGLYNAHNEWVKKNIPSDRLLIMELGEGWERMCKFLDKPVPSEPYPRVNSTDSFKQMIESDEDLFEKIKMMYNLKKAENGAGSS
ncbi:hypothetical protein K492DRAFT_145421 [Lichtheimia hyalospora FSU 10163]|nr:hypothetical protein K492DRAFT_145421 [Lichtheimia hyalospora FSU 10163]